MEIFNQELSDRNEVRESYVEAISKSKNIEFTEEYMLPTKENKDCDYRNCQFGEVVSPEGKEETLKILSFFKDVFSKNSLDIGSHRGVKVALHFDDQKCIKEPERFFSLEKREHLVRLVEELEEAGIVELYTEDYPVKAVSNVVMIKKNEGRTKAEKFLNKMKKEKEDPVWRMTIDARNLNNALINVPLTTVPMIDHILQKVRGKIVSQMDFTQAFFSLEVTDESKPYLCFHVNGQVYTFNRLLQGLKSSPAIFIMTANETFSDGSLRRIKRIAPEEIRKELDQFDTFDSFLQIYVDDIFIYSENESQHRAHLWAVL